MFFRTHFQLINFSCVILSALIKTVEAFLFKDSYVLTLGVTSLKLAEFDLYHIRILHQLSIKYNYS